MGVFNIFRKRYCIASSSFLCGREDRHCHILFGVDDGIETIEESLQALEYEESLGINHVWCTPHIMEDVPNSTEVLCQRFNELKQAYTGPISLHLAAEYMLDNLFEERLKSYDAVIHFNISSGFSSCHTNAKLAAEDFENVRVIDSQNLSTGQGLVVLKACELAETITRSNIPFSFLKYLHIARIALAIKSVLPVPGGP